MPYTKDIDEIQYEKFVDHRTGKSSNELPLPSMAYWKALQDVLILYTRHNDNKFYYIVGIGKRKHIVANRIRYIGKESNNLGEVNVLGIQDDPV